MYGERNWKLVPLEVELAVSWFIYQRLGDLRHNQFPKEHKEGTSESTDSVSPLIDNAEAIPFHFLYVNMQHSHLRESCCGQKEELALITPLHLVELQPIPNYLIVVTYKAAY